MAIIKLPPSDFLSIETVAQLASFLGISIQKLRFILYKAPNKYTEFEIPKKGGGSRQIASPVPLLKNIQLQLKPHFDQAYRPTSATHGYVNDKSVITNASKHLACIPLRQVTKNEQYWKQ